MRDKQERLIHLLRALGDRADHVLRSGGGGMTLASYPPMVRMYNDYATQAGELYGEELLTRPDHIELREAEAEIPGVIAELALRANQLAGELELILAQDGDSGERVDWADALVRLEEAGIDTDNILDHLRRNMGPGGMVRRRWVDRLERLAEAGIDVDDVLPLMGMESFIDDVDLTRSRSRHGRRRSRREPHPSPFASVGREIREAVEQPLRKYQLEIRHPVEPPEFDDRALEEAWKLDIINKVQKGELTAEEGAGLLEKGWPGNHDDDEENDE